MKMKVKLDLLFGTLLLAAGTYLSGCTDKGTTPGVPQVSKGEPIQFSVGTVADAQSRTVYVDDYQLEWNIGDKIKIWCNEPSPKSVDYVVVDTIYSEHGGAITPIGTDTLKWGELGIPYTFYSAYPADRVTDVSNIANGEFGMEYITNQLDTVVSLSNGAYLTNPDMNNAYMLAKQEVTPEASQHHVRLNFDPIMTTFDITVRAGRYEVATGIINPVTVTGVSVIMPNKIDSDKFTYNAKDGTTSDKGSVEASDGFQSVYVGVRNGTSRYVDLHEGETLNLMAFLPPVDMNNGDVKMMVHTTAMNYVLTVPGNQITKQNKYFIQLPDMSPYDSAYNDWISELDSTTLLTQMSIPAYVCTGEETEEDIKNLLKMGVRAISIDKFFESNLEIGTSDYQLTPLEKESGKIKNVLEDFLTHSTDFLILWYNDGHGSSRTRCEKYFDKIFEDFKDKEILKGEEGWITLDKASVSSAISNLLNKRILVIKQNTYGAYSYFIPQDVKPLEGYKENTKLFPYITLENAESLNTSENGWGAQFITDNPGPINKKLYEYISSYDEQTGCTGIVTIPNATDTYADGQYNYSDLLIQSIIDCNFKFRH